MENDCNTGANYHCGMLSKWMYNALKSSGISQSELSRKMSEQLHRSIDRAAVNKMVKGLRHISAEELLVIEALTGVAAPRRKPTPTEISEARPVAGNIRVAGIVEAGNWFDVDNDATIGEIAVPALLGHPLDWQSAYVVSGNSINRIAKPGEILVCLDLNKSGAAIENDDVVILERSRFDGQMMERSAKVAKKTRRGWEFWPSSDDTSDPKNLEPISYESEGDHATINLVAKVLWIVRPHKKP